MITGINHIATLTSDMDRTVGFYQQVFGGDVVHEEVPREGHPWMKILGIGGDAYLNIFEVPADSIIGDRRRIGGRGAIDHFGIAADTRESLEDFAVRLAEAGAQEVGEIQRLGNEWSLFFRDPDGMELEICAPVTDAL